MRTPFIGGNWKMNTDHQSAVALACDVANELNGVDADVCVFPPFCYLAIIGSELSGSDIKLGAQDCWYEPNGAFTGEVSIGMLRDCGVSVVLTGHSERRHVIGESDELVGLKTAAVLDAGLECVLCVGEQLEERERGETDAVNERQIRAGLADVRPDEIANLTIAYEPVWAIGTGRTATPADAQDAHAKIRALLGEMYSRDIAETVRIQYGGSVKPGNAAELFAQADIDGGLIGGASLKPEDFTAIVRAAL